MELFAIKIDGRRAHGSIEQHKERVLMIFPQAPTNTLQPYTFDSMVGENSYAGEVGVHEPEFSYLLATWV